MCVTAIGVEAVLYKLLAIVFIQLIVLIIGFSLRYCWFVDKSNAFAYLKKQSPTSIDIEKNEWEEFLLVNTVLQHFLLLMFMPGVYDYCLLLAFSNLHWFQSFLEMSMKTYFKRHINYLRRHVMIFDVFPICIESQFMSLSNICKWCLQ